LIELDTGNDMAMDRIGLRSIASHLPDEVEYREAYSYLLDMIPDPDDFPVERRRDRRPDAAELMAMTASEKALDEAGLDAKEIDLIIVANYPKLWVCSTTLH